MKKINIILTIVVFGLFLSACGSDSDDIPTLGATPTSVAADAEINDEAKVMAFTQCMREQGIEFKDPMVDSDGNVQRPELVEATSYSRQEIRDASEECQHFLEGLTLGRGREDLSELVDQLIELAICLRDKGYDMDDPTAETLKQWQTDFRQQFDWDAPGARDDFQECGGDTGNRNDTNRN